MSLDDFRTEWLVCGDRNKNRKPERPKTGRILTRAEGIGRLATVDSAQHSRWPLNPSGVILYVS